MQRTMLPKILTVLFLLLCSPSAWGAEAQYVIHISLDGCRGDLLAAQLSQDSAGELSHFRKFVDEGATTFNARADYFYTNTLPNHTSMLTGRPVLQPADQPNTVDHGYTSNSDPPPGETLHNGGNPHVEYIASVFDVVHDAGMSTALYASKSKFLLYDRSYDEAHGAVDSVPPDNGRDKIDRYLYVDSGDTASGMHAAFLSEMGKNHYNYCFVHYLDLDSAGHDHGWGSDAWNAALRVLDGYLGEIFALVESDPVLAGHTAILVTADHGGKGKTHGRAALVEDATIPVLAWGAGVARGADLYALNESSRRDPGSGRPDYDAPSQPIRNGDTGNLALRLLGLHAIPGSTVNAAQDLEPSGSTPVPHGSGTHVKSENRGG